MSWLNLGSALGFVGLALLAWAAGGFRRPVAWRTVGGASALLLVLASLVFWLPATRAGLLAVNEAVVAALDASNEGARFLFGPLAVGPGGKTAAGEPSIGFVLAAQVFPALVFFSALMAGLYYLGVVQLVVRFFARVFQRTLMLSGAEALAGASNIFVGIESAMTVRPYLERMTRSELLMLLSCGMATVASTTLALYVLFLRSVFPAIAGHLISASVLSIPAAALVSKLMLPETEMPLTAGKVPPGEPEVRPGSFMEALMAGSLEGIRLSAGIAGLLIAVLGLVALADLVLAQLPHADGADPWSVASILTWVFTPLAWLLGISPGDVPEVARLLGMRAVMTEIVAYQELARLASEGALEPRSLLVASYALCGFTHVASMAIFVGGVATLAPSRRADLAALGPRALVAATLATLMTGALAGAFYVGQEGLLGLGG